MKFTAKDILDNNSEELVKYYKFFLTGNGGQTYCRLYLDLDDGSLFESCEASCNTWLQRDDDSLIILHGHNSYGADLNEEELEWLEEDGVSDFGFQEWIDNEIEPAIEAALNGDN